MSSSVDLTVLIPCLNEEGNLRELSERVRQTLDELAIQWELLLVDDGSQDSTWMLIETLMSRDSRIRGARHDRNLGIAAAWQTGLEHAVGRHICILDADLQYQPEDIARLWREIHFRNVDIVQGIRNSLTRVRDHRFHLSRGLNDLLNFLFRMDFKDNKSGFVLTRRNVFAHILERRFRYHYFQTFIMVSAHTKGYTATQVDTIFEPRHVGTSFVSRFPFKIVALSLLDLAKAFVEFRFRSDRDVSLERFVTRHPPSRLPEARPFWRRVWLRLYFASMWIHHWMIRGTTRHYLAALERSQYLAPAELRRYQELRLRQIVEHAYYNTSYYREAMRAAGVRPEDIRTLEDLVKLPTLSKEECRRNLYKGLLANRYDPSKVLRITTSGSTGEPFVCYADKRQLEFRWAATHRSMEWTGYRFGDRQLRLWHQTIGMTWFQSVRELLDAVISRRRFIPVFELKEATLPLVLRQVGEFRPILVDGYAEAFNLLANYLKSHPFAGVRPRGIISSAQTLPEDSRSIIEQAFGCRVFDKYGSREFSGIAYECENHDGHHVVAENFVVEILRDGRPAAPGEMGEVVITDLNNFTMPLLRYRIGDLAVAMDASEVCGCGRGLPRIGAIQGRVQSLIVGRNRELLPGTFFAHVLKDFDKSIRRYQIVQHKVGEIEFVVVKGPRFTEAEFERCLAILQEFLGDETAIHIEFVDQIEMVRTGKHNAVLSKLRIDFQTGKIDEGAP